MNRHLKHFAAFLLVNAAVLSWGQLPGDFNEDGVYNCSDIDALNADVGLGGANLVFDLDADGQVTRSDVEAWLRIAGTVNNGEPYIYGDANLDGQVDNSDLGGIWNSNKFTNSDQWCQSDHNSDGVVDLYDGLLTITNLLSNDQDDVGYGPAAAASEIARFIYDPQTGHMFSEASERIGVWIIPGPEPDEITSFETGFDSTANMLWLNHYFNGSQQTWGTPAPINLGGAIGNHHFLTYPMGLAESDFGLVTYGSWPTVVDLEGLLSTEVEIMEVLPGDANLDGVVDVGDFNALNAHKFGDFEANWGQGDFNGDQVVDVSDFNIWNENKFQMSGDGSLAIPEPSAWAMLVCILGVFLWRRRRLPKNRLITTAV